MNLNTDPATPDSALPQQLASEQLITGPQVDTLLSISRPTRWRMVKRGVLPKPIILGGSMRRWRFGDIQKVVTESQAA